MSRVIMVSYHFPQEHPRSGESTYFVEKIWKSLQESEHFDVGQWANNYHLLRDIFMNPDIMNPSPKHHTIRAGKRWKDGDMASLRIWSDKPYRSKQIPIAPDVKLKVVDIEINQEFDAIIDGKDFPLSSMGVLATNDGLSFVDFISWFSPSIPFSGQILIWNNSNLDY
jgi:hypothetical protein